MKTLPLIALAMIITLGIAGCKNTHDNNLNIPDDHPHDDQEQPPDDPDDDDPDDEDPNDDNSPPSLESCEGDLTTALPWEPPGAWPNDHYNGGDLVTHNGYIWQAKWWTNTEPGTDDTWRSCSVHHVGQLQVSFSGDVDALSDDQTLTITLGNNHYSTRIQGDTLGLAPGSYAISVDRLLDFDTMQAYLPTPSINFIEVAEEGGDYQLDIALQAQTIPMHAIEIYVDFAGQDPEQLPSLQVNGVEEAQAYSEQTDALYEGQNFIDVPGYGEYTLKPRHFSVDNTTYIGNSLIVIDGALQNTSIILYQEQAYQPLMVGYLTSWNKQLLISEAAEQGYDTVVLAFATVEGETVGMFETWNIYVDWNNPDQWETAMRQDIESAKNAGLLKHVILSVGGQNNTFKPRGANVNMLANNILSYASKVGANGIDFDLEHVGDAFGTDDPETYLAEIIRELKKQDPDFLITSAPQFNHIQAHEVNLVNTGTEQIYNQAVAEGGFDYIFVQLYNTGHYYMDSTGKGYLDYNKPADAVNQTDPQFVVNSYARLKQIIPASTKIVPGQPSDILAGGAATVYYGIYASTDEVYKKLCEAYQDTRVYNDPQFGGAMTWSINQDAANDFRFLNSVFADNCDER